MKATGRIPLLLLRVWILPGFLLLLALGIASFLNRAASLHGEDGVFWEERGGSVVAARIALGGPGDRGGLQSGDVLVAIDSESVNNDIQVRDLLWGRGGRSVLYRIQRGGRPETIRIRPVLNGEENRVFYYLWLVGGITLLAGCLAAWKLPAEPGSRSFFGWTVFLYLALACSAGGAGGWLDWALYGGDLVGRLLAPPLLILFIDRLSRAPDGPRPRRRASVFLFLPAAVLLGWKTYLVALGGALAFPNPPTVLTIADRLETLHFTFFSIGAVALLLRRLWGATEARVRWKLHCLALSAATGLLPAAFLDLLPTALGIPPGPAGELSILPVAIVPFGFAAALFQDRVIDLDHVLRRMIQGAFAGTVFLGGAFGGSFLLSKLLRGHGEPGILVEAGLPLTLSGLATMALLPRSAGWIDRLLGRRMPDPSHALLQFREDLDGELHLERLTHRLVSRIRKVFDLERVAILARHGSSDEFRFAAVLGFSESPLPDTLRLPGFSSSPWASRETVLLGEDGGPRGIGLSGLAILRCRYLFPLAVRGRSNALLLTGGCRDGRPLDGRTLEALAALASQIARSIESARLYSEIEDRIARECGLRRQTQAILESSRIGILLVDAEGRVNASNQAAATILGRPDPVGDPVNEVLPRGLLLLLDRSARRISGGKEGRVFRFSFGAADGRARIVNVTRSPLEGAPGTGQVYTVDDVTDEVRREELALQQSRLASMGLLMSQVAHEVNTPLTGIASYAQVLMSRMRSPGAELDLLRKIETQAFRAADIAGSVLRFARNKKEDPGPLLDPGTVIAECLPLFEAHLKGKRIRVRLARGESLPAVRGDRGQLQQVAMNLLLNAAAALPGGGEVRIDVDRVDDFLKIQVTDNGIGIPPEVLPRIFEPFFSARSDGEGTGLGLWIAREIVRGFQGEIGVESIPGEGSTFTVLLPEATPVGEGIHA